MRMRIWRASFIDIDKILSLFQSHVECMNYLNSNSDEKCMEHHSSVHLSDVDALRIIQAKHLAIPLGLSAS